ncbi:MAG: hydroxyisourate hydrolase [Phycisphaerales bacterium]|nr:hydroxyisourate hydrolase [Phycisphaerales bacterium]
MSGISTHVLDVSRGMAAAGVGVVFERLTGGAWIVLSSVVTDNDGRVKALLPAGMPSEAGDYRLRFATGPYWTSQGVACFHPSIEVTFRIADATVHHHVPLLVSPFGYTTYRGT